MIEYPANEFILSEGDIEYWYLSTESFPGLPFLSGAFNSFAIT